MKNNHKPIARFIHRDRLRSSRLGDTRYYERTTLFTYLSRYFATDAICRVFSRYGLLADLEYEQDGLYGIAFPFQDDKTRQLLSMQYDPATGRQTGEQPIGQRLMKGYDLQSAPALCGTHLLPEYPGKPVGILRDLRDILIMTLADDTRLWLATGNSNRNGYSLTDPAIMEVLRGRSITLYPASGLYDASMPIAHRMQEQGIDTTISNAAEQLTTGMTSDAQLTIPISFSNRSRKNNSTPLIPLQRIIPAPEWLRTPFVIYRNRTNRQLRCPKCRTCRRVCSPLMEIRPNNKGVKSEQPGIMKYTLLIPRFRSGDHPTEGKTPQENIRGP